MDETLLLEDERNDLAEARELDEDHGHCTEVIEQFAIRLVTLRGELVLVDESLNRAPQLRPHSTRYAKIQALREVADLVESTKAELAAAQRRLEKCAGLGIDEILKMQRELAAAKEQIEQFKIACAPLMGLKFEIPITPMAPPPEEAESKQKPREVSHFSQ